MPRDRRWVITFHVALLAFGCFFFGAKFGRYGNLGWMEDDTHILLGVACLSCCVLGMTLIHVWKRSA